MTFQTATQADVARKAGVSRGLVSLALADSPRVNDQTKQRILQAAADLGYTRNLRAAELAGNKSTIVGILLPTLHNPVYASLVDHIQEHAAKSGLVALQATTGNDPAHELKLVSQFQELRVAGVICLSPRVGAKDLEPFSKQLPLTTVGTGPMDGHIDVAHCDEVKAAELVFAHALNQGYQRVVQISSAEDAEPAIKIRQNAYSLAAQKTGMKPEIYTPETSIRQSVQQIISESGDQRTLIMTHNDLIALDTISTLRALGFVAGQQFGLVGYDNTELAQRAEFDVTSIDQQPEILGAEAVRLIQQRETDLLRVGEEVIVTPTLAVRSSS